MSTTKFLRLSARPECPHCGVENEPPADSRLSSFETHCIRCLKPYRVVLHIRYATEAIASEETPQATADFRVSEIDDIFLSSEKSKVAELAGADTNLTKTQRDVVIWTLFESECRTLRSLRETPTHSFHVIRGFSGLRIYHARGCGCTHPVVCNV